jgi:hypothetical protein
MCIARLARTVRRTALYPSLVPLLALLVAGGLLPEEADAQRPFRIYDPFYRNETARRSFFDGYAFTTEVSYRAAGAIQGDGRQAVEADPLGLSFRLDYQLTSRLDLSAILDASGSLSGRSLSLSWIVLKYYQHVENTDYAFRLAVDPSSDGLVGFPQLDFAFIATSLLTPMISSDFAIGMRRVRMGYEQLVRNEDPLAEQPRAFRYWRAIGVEVHFMMQYSVLLNPARSNVFVAMIAEGGSYELVEQASPRGGLAAALGAGAPSWEGDYRGGVVWIRPGIEYNRPSYQLTPFLNIPLKQWVPEEGDWNEARLHVGFRLMFR